MFFWFFGCFSLNLDFSSSFFCKEAFASIVWLAWVVVSCGLASSHFDDFPVSFRSVPICDPCLRAYLDLFGVAPVSSDFFPFLLIRYQNLGGHFGPEKKYLAPPPPNSRQTPSGPLATPHPLSWEKPPPLLACFNKKSTPPPLRPPLSPPPSRKKKKNIRNVHRGTNQNKSGKPKPADPFASPRVLKLPLLFLVACFAAALR